MCKLIFVFVIFTMIINDCCESRQITRTPVTYRKGVKEAVLEAIQRCNGGDKLPGIIKLIREGNYVEDEYFRKFIYCAYKESGYSHENGRINLEAVVRAIEDEVELNAMLKVMRGCDKQLSDPETTTFEYFKCFQDNTPYLLRF